MEKTKLDLLLDRIREHNNAYRAGIPIVSDQEYDAEIDELRRLDPDNEWFKRIEPAIVSARRKTKLPIPMRSLKKAKDISELQNWLISIEATDNTKIVITPKFDGLSLLYEEATQRAFSRGGDENEGQDCTAHAQMANILSKPTHLKYTYGEFVFNCETWKNVFEGQINPESGDKYKSPRNTAAGLLNRDRPSENLKYVDFFRYGTDENSLKYFDTYSHLYKFLCSEYDQQLLYHIADAAQLSEEFLNGLFRAWRELYYIDGLVLYADDLKIWKRVGRQDNTGDPNYAIAYKHPDFTETIETIVTSVSWNVSKAGALKPVINIEPVDIENCEIKNITGYNALYIFENKIASGARVLITRSGGVIPKILGICEPASDKALKELQDDLTLCPICGYPTKWNDSRIELLCSNEKCEGIAFAKVIHFYTTLGAQNLGPDTIARLFKAQHNSLRRILNISFDELISIDGIGEVTANNILNINNSIRRGVDVAKLMHASDCFVGIGETTARSLLRKMSDTDRYCFENGLVSFDEDYQNTGWYQALNITRQRFVDGIAPFYNFLATNDLKALPTETIEVSGDKYKGFNVCFSGVRDKALELAIASGGGQIVNSVSKNTTHLVVANAATQSLKVRRAKMLGATIITIDEFRNL